MDSNSVPHSNVIRFPVEMVREQVERDREQDRARRLGECAVAFLEMIDAGIPEGERLARLPEFLPRKYHWMLDELPQPPAA